MTDTEKIAALERRCAGLEKGLLRALDALKELAQKGTWKTALEKVDYTRAEQAIGWAEADIKSNARANDEAVK